MKRIALFLVGAIISLSNVVAQNPVDRWDAKNQAYINYKYGFLWHLNPDLEWEQQTSLFQKEAVFAAKDVDTNTVAYITIEENKGGGDDIWPGALQYKMGLLNTTRRYGKSFHLLEFTKCQIAGKNALRFKSTYTVHGDDRMQEDMQFVIVGYSVMLNGSIVTFQIMACKEVEDFLKVYGQSIRKRGDCSCRQSPRFVCR